MEAKGKPAYESPKASSLDYKETVIGGEAGVTCSTGSNAIGECTDIGNSAILSCNEGSAAVESCDFGNGDT